MFVVYGHRPQQRCAMSPQRVQLRRTKGYRKPEGAIVVARPSKWGNPFQVGEMVQRDDPRFEFIERYARLRHGQGFSFRGFSAISSGLVDDVVGLYDFWLAQYPPLFLRVREELADHDLACWCPLDQPCHADVLLEIANASVGDTDHRETR